MKYTAIVNVENLEATPFLVINLYDEYLIDQIIGPYEGPERAIERIKELMQVHGQPVRCYTSNKEIYALTLSEPGIIGEIKHYDETKITASSLKDSEEVLRDLYEIEPIVPLPKLPAWRRWLFIMLLKIANKVGGNGYEI
jgi:hypothetical protein